MNFVKLTSDNLCVETLYQMVSSPEFGAVSLFVGTTRNNFDGKKVTKLEYEAYEPMALKSLEDICQKTREKFGVGNIAIYHRIGDVPIQEASVIIAISSTHRASGLSAVPFAIDALKADVPIWKKEVYENDQPSVWKENSESNELNSAKNIDSIHLYEEVVEADDENAVPSHLIQVKANAQEINRRINSFIQRKREQINLNNIQDFCLEKSETSCARVSAIVKRRKDCKSHLKVHRVENMTGPQTHGFDPGSGGSVVEQPPNENFSLCPVGAEERLANAEIFLNVNQSSKDIFARLKAIEDKILYLESVSPEYFDLDKLRSGGPTASKKTYSATELKSKLENLEAKLKRKSSARFS